MSFKPLFGQAKIFYGADYNPEQWLDYPEILQQDIRMMRQAHISILSLGIFSWAKLEPEEGHFDFAWLDRIIDQLHASGIKVLLATPSGARPAWLSQRYPEVLRVNENRQRALHGGRHNHCMSSPVYRRKTEIINTKLAERYAHHPAVAGWHISNEYGGFCHCPLCQAKFREYLKQRYHTLENLNRSWWNTFWSHTYTSWDQIESPSPLGESAVHGLYLDWRRFSSRNALDFCRAEINTVRPFNPDLPCTTNFMEFFEDYDYFEWADSLDFISWDSYPTWHEDDDPENPAAYTAMNHDLMRSLKHGQPFVLMEQTPSVTNWRPLSVLKRPGMTALASLQAAAHGADSLQFFQWRKSRGSSEKFHGAFVDHEGTLNTRVGRECIDLGARVEKLGCIAGSCVRAEAAVILDTPNRWILNNIQGPRNNGLDYIGWLLDWYKPLWRRGISVDVIDETRPLDQYKLVIAPLSYMLRPGYAEAVEQFVSRGGTYLATCWSGIADENDLCFLGGFPGPLRPVMGIWEEEMDCLDDGRTAAISPCVPASDAAAGIFRHGSYSGSMLCASAHLEGARALACFTDPFREGQPALTVNSYGSGEAYYAATRTDAALCDDLTAYLAARLHLKRAVDCELPRGVTAHRRCGEQEDYLFLQNYGAAGAQVTLSGIWHDLCTEESVSGTVSLPPYGCMVLSGPAR